MRSLCSWNSSIAARVDRAETLDAVTQVFDPRLPYLDSGVLRHLLLQLRTCARSRSPPTAPRACGCALRISWRAIRVWSGTAAFVPAPLFDLVPQLIGSRKAWLSPQTLAGLRRGWSPPQHAPCSCCSGAAAARRSVPCRHRAEPPGRCSALLSCANCCCIRPSRREANPPGCIDSTRSAIS